MRGILGVVLLLGACGDNFGDGGDGAAEDLGATATQGNADSAPAPGARLVPAFCGGQNWNLDLGTTRDVAIAIASSEYGAAILATPRNGGALQMVQLDTRGLVSSDTPPTTIRQDLAFTDVAAAFVDERLVVSARGPSGVVFDMVRPDVGTYKPLGSYAGDLVAPLTHLRPGTRIAAVAGREGVTTVQFDEDWRQVHANQLSAEPSFGMTALQFEEDTVVGWSTETRCHLQRLDGGVRSARDYPCHGPRLAMDAANGRGLMVSEDEGRVVATQIVIGGESELAGRVVLATGSSPRVTYDGTRFWVSYLDTRSDLIVGFLEGTELVTTHSQTVRPTAGSHELGLVGGRPYALSFDDAGLSAHALCVSAESPTRL